MQIITAISDGFAAGIMSGKTRNEKYERNSNQEAMNHAEIWC